MKFGTHIYVLTDSWSDDNCRPILDQCKELGLDSVELAVGDDVHFTPALTRRHAEALDLDLTISPGGVWPLACDLSSPDAADRAAGLTWHKQQIDLAAELGALAYCGATYGHTGVVRKERPNPEEYRRIAPQLHELAEYGARHGVAVVLEPMSHFRTHLVNTPQQIKRLVDMADHDNLYILLDTYHLITEILDFAAGIHHVADKLWAIHACENNRGRPMPNGLVPWGEVCQALLDTGFTGYILLESYNSSIRDGDFAYERGMFHHVCDDGKAFIQEGIGFLKAELAEARR